VERFGQEYKRPKLKDPKRYHMDAASLFKVRILPFRHLGAGPTMGSRPAASITPIDVERLRDGLTAEGYAPNTVRHTLRSLSRPYTWAKRAGAVDCSNPVSGIERPTAVQEVDYLRADEVGRLLAAASDAARNAVGVAALQAEAVHGMIAVGVYAGLRRGELFGLRWIDLDFEANRIDVLRSYTLLPKSGKARQVGLNAELAPILRRWQALCPATLEGLVFPVLTPGGKWIMGRADDELGIAALFDAARCHHPADGHRLHLLRHTFGSHFIMRGGNILALRDLLGHSHVKTTEIYAHLAPGFRQSEIARMSFAVAPAADVVSLDARRGSQQ
jgi:integrase